jgi:hypothetical protein
MIQAARLTLRLEAEASIAHPCAMAIHHALRALAAPAVERRFP